MVNEKEQRVIRLAESLTRLKGLQISTPEVLLDIRIPANSEERMRNIALAKATLMVLKPNIKVILPELVGFGPLEDTEAKSEIENYTGDALIILKSPRTKILVEGICCPSPYYLRVKIGGVKENVLWGQVKGYFGDIYSYVIRELSNTLSRCRLELDGCEMRFTYHGKGEGTFGDKILLWGNSQ